MSNNKLTFNAKSFPEFKLVYERAKSDNVEIFEYQGNEFVTSYAKYLIEYIENENKC